MAKTLRWIFVICLLLTWSVKPTYAQELDVYLGMNKSSWHFDGGDWSIDKFTTITQPYTMRHLEVKLHNYYGLELGFNHLSNKILSFTGFADDNTELSFHEDPIATIFGGFTRYRFSEYWFGQATTEFRRFEVERTFLGRWINAAYPMPYLNAKGTVDTLVPDDKVTWSSSFRDFQLGVLCNVIWMLFEDEDEEDGQGAFLFLGYHGLSYDAPVTMNLMRRSNLGQGFNALMAATMSTDFIDVAFFRDAEPIPETRPFDWGMRMQVGFGQTTIENKYFEASGGLSIGYGADVKGALALDFNRANMRFEVGIRWDYFSTFLLVDSTNAKQDVPYLDLFGAQGVWPKEEAVYISVISDEYFWGPFLKMSMSFDLSRKPTEAEKK